MRYSKQELVKGWDQKRLKDLEITVVGSNNLASFISLDLIAMGFGKVTRIGKHKLAFVELEAFNPDVEFQEIEGDLLNQSLAEEFIGNPDFLIDASNNETQKRTSLRYAKRKKLRTLSASCSPISYSIIELEEDIDKAMGYHKELTLAEIANNGNVNPIVASAIIADETRKRLMPLQDEKRLRRFYVQDAERKIGGKLLVVGAGAIGTFAGISLALSGEEFDVIDFDDVEESNLNRQVLFYNSLGRYKAEVMAEKLSGLTKVKGFVGKVDSKYQLGENYKAILSCVDNSEARYYLNLISHKRKIPLINSGTSSFAGRVMPYVPGKNACLDCQTFGMLSSAVREHRKDTSCYEPTIITSNQIIGGLLVGRIPKVFNGNLEMVSYSSSGGIKKTQTLNSCLEDCSKHGSSS